MGTSKRKKDNTNQHNSNQAEYRQDSAIAKFKKRNEADHSDVPQLENSQFIDELILNIQQKDHEALNKVLLEILSPQLTENEVQKRNFKERLMKYVLRVLIGQLIFVGVPVVGVVAVGCVGCFVGGQYMVTIVGDMFSFLKFYITAIIAELLAMLFFIVKFVFDKSIVDLMSEIVGKRKK